MLFQAHFGTLDARMREQEERFERKLEGLKSELLRWMFLFWILTIGIVLAAGRLHG